MSASKITVISTSYQEVMALLTSDSLRAVEEEIASKVGMSVLREYEPATTNYTQAEISISGISASQIERSLGENAARIIAFGVHFLQDAEATRDEEEYPAGEEPGEEDKSVTVAQRGLGTGFGITYAIYYNFLANRTPSEFREFLRNRRIPHHARFAKESRRVFEEASCDQA